MNAPNVQLWTIEELGAQVALALSIDYDGQGNGRVRDVPDLRTIRYYATLGLIDRPAAMRGRTALYGPRHLLQLVAIKRLQAKGQTLAQLQEALLGKTDREMAGIAKLPVPASRGTPAGRESFWNARPGPVEKPIALPRREPEQILSDVPLQGIRLADDVTLLVSPARPVEDDDLDAIRTVAAPLVKLLHQRRLLRPRDERTQT